MSHWNRIVRNEIGHRMPFGIRSGVRHRNWRGIRPLTLAALLACTAGAWAQAKPTEAYTGPLQDAWLDGRIEAAYMFNRYLNPFEIDTRVEDGVVYLSGAVATNEHRILARDIARAVEGVERVENDIVVDPGVPGAVDPVSHVFVQTVADATTTAMVKTRLLANDLTDGLDIGVDTENDVVTLSGTVSSETERELAAELARKVDDVELVVNRLEVARP